MLRAVAASSNGQGALNFYLVDCATDEALAAIKLQPQAAEWLPGQDWDAMRGFGNVLRHDYDVVSEKMIWEIAQDFLPGLLDDCRRALKLLEAQEG